MTLPQMLADKIGKMVNQKFSELIQTKPQHARRKVLAGIVITKGQDAELICVTTGKTLNLFCTFQFIFKQNICNVSIKMFFFFVL